MNIKLINDQKMILLSATFLVSEIACWYLQRNPVVRWSKCVQHYIRVCIVSSPLFNRRDTWKICSIHIFLMLTTYVCREIF